MSLSYEPQMNSQMEDSAAYARVVLGGVDTSARSMVVNRTHRVVRERAAVMQARRSYARSLMVPLAICSVLLVLLCAGVWTGLYEYQGAETVQADIAALDANNHLLVVLLWFVPLTLAILGAVLFRRIRNTNRRTVR